MNPTTSMLFLNRRRKTPVPFSDGYTAAQSGDDLIKRPAVLNFIQELRALVALPEAHFSELYISPITRYLVLTQHCPRERVAQHLRTVVLGLKRRRALLLPPGVTPEAIGYKKDLWSYVAFVVLLMYNVADQVNGYAVIYKKPGEKHREARRWCPFQGALAPPYGFQVVGQLPVSPYADLVLLPSFLNLVGLSWLYGDSEAYNTVVTTLAAPDTESPLGDLLVNTLALSGKQKSNNAASASASASASAPAPAPASEEVVGGRKSPPADISSKPIGEQFWEWLMQSVNSKSDIDNVSINPTSEGIALLCPDIFRQFLAGHNAQKPDVSWEDVQQAFLALNRHKRSPKTGKNFHQSQWPGRGTCQVIVLPTLGNIPNH
ncbi:MAG: TraI domain-containing protein [Exilibacterium sp.]